MLFNFPQNRTLKMRLAAPVMTVLVCVCLAGSVFAQGVYLNPRQPDGVALLPPPPAAGSPEEAADLATVRTVFHGRTPAEEKRATKDASLSFSLFAAAIGPEFKPEKLPKTWLLLQEVKKEMSTVIDTPKDHWQRRRPYLLDPQLTLGAPEPSFSYPSGHSTRGTAYSLVLAEIFPAHRDAILQIGRNIGWDRVLIGKHFPTDVYAGRVLGYAILNELKKSPMFMHDLAEARAEAEAVQSASTASASRTPEAQAVGTTR